MRQHTPIISERTSKVVLSGCVTHGLCKRLPSWCICIILCPSSRESSAHRGLLSDLSFAPGKQASLSGEGVWRPDHCPPFLVTQNHHFSPGPNTCSSETQQGSIHPPHQFCTRKLTGSLLTPGSTFPTSLLGPKSRHPTPRANHFSEPKIHKRS